jgi:hypothetical protein
MTLELLDVRFARAGYPKTVTYTESDFPDRWEQQWRRRGAFDTPYYGLQTSKHITYSLNSQGYRETEWKNIDWSNSILCFGCSHTFGVGVSENETIPRKLFKKTNINCVNLGIPGGNNAFTMFNSAKLINHGIRPLGIIFQRTYAARWFDIESQGKLMPLTISDKKYKKHLGNEKYINFLDDSITEAIKSQWLEICPIIEYSMEMFPDHSEDIYIARDGAHYNDLYFEKVVNVLSKNIINTISTKET